MTHRLRELSWSVLVGLLLVASEELDPGQVAVAFAAMLLVLTREPEPGEWPALITLRHSDDEERR